MVASSFPPERPLTIEDFEAMPDDGQRYESLLREFVESPSPNTRHQRIHTRLFRRLDSAVLRDGLGEVFSAPHDLRLSPHNVVEPDLLAGGTEQRHKLTRHRFEGAPLLIIEITSPSSEHVDLVKKAARYEQAGVCE